jgi:hypothetical protein
MRKLDGEWISRAVKKEDPTVGEGMAANAATHSDLSGQVDS